MLFSWEAIVFALNTCVFVLSSFMGNMSWSWFLKKIQYVYYDSCKFSCCCQFLPILPHSTAKQLSFQVCLCVLSIDLVLEALLAAALILYNIQTPFSNISLRWSDTCSHKLVPYAVSPSFQCEQTGFISRPSYSFFLKTVTMKGFEWASV